MTEHELLNNALSVVDRALGPIVSRLESMENNIGRRFETIEKKLDQVAKIETAHGAVDARLVKVESDLSVQKDQINKQSGRSEIIGFVVAAIIVPIILVFAYAGLKALIPGLVQ